MDLDSLKAPQFVDFTKPLDNEDEDNYFDFDHEKGGKRILLDDPFKAESSDSIYGDAMENADDLPFEITNDLFEPASKIPRNLCTSLDSWRKGDKPKTPPVKAAVKAEPVRRSPRVKNAVAADKKDCVPSSGLTKKEASASSCETNVKRPDSTLANTDAPKRSRTRSAADRSLPMKSENRTAVSKLKRTGSFRGSFKANNSRTESKEVTHSFKIKPKTPECLKREMKTAGNKILKSTSERQLQNAEDFKKALAQKRKQNEKYRLKAMAATVGVLPKRDSKSLTRPEEFHFKTDERLKSHGMETRQDGDNDSRDFTASLRTQHPASPKPAIQRTKVQPFSFDRKRKRPSEEGEGAQFKSMAEMVKKFSNQTPDRFRKRGNSKDRSPTKRRRRSMSQPHLTLPKTPNLQTRSRARPAHVKSYDELQEEEYEQHNKQQFKAHPVNEKIFDKKYAGVKKAPPRALTQPVTPQLELRRRAANWRDRSEHEESYEFHANPVPKAILDGPTGVKPAQHLPLTVPESPAFALRNRVANIVKEKDPEPEMEARSLRGRPVPKFGVPFKPKLETKVTEPRPFSFAERMRADQQKKEEKIMKLAEEKIQMKEFHANPIPDLSPELPPKQVKPATRPKPFLLELDVRGKSKAEEWSNKIKEELKSVREQASFKAKPSKTVAKEPFIPKKSNKPLTDVNEIQLNTEKRIEERVQWEKWRTEKDQEKHELEMQRQRLKEHEERENEKHLRKQMEPKAKPIRKYKEVAIKSSDKPLTQPHSPQFAADRTLRRSMRC